MVRRFKSCPLHQKLCFRARLKRCLKNNSQASKSVFTIDELVTMLDNCLQHYEVVDVKRIAFEGRGKKGKLFAIVTSDSELVIKCDDYEQFESLQQDGAEVWIPPNRERSESRWLIITDEMLRNPSLVCKNVQHSYDNLITPA